jgi:hypothetical protein
MTNKELVRVIRKAIREIRVINTWEHAVMFYDGSRTTTYVNGVERK